MEHGPSGRLEAVIAKVAPGTTVRHGLERILRASHGSLIVLGDSPELRPLLSGGFRIDVLVTAQRLSELAKMDGAMVLDADAKTILWANVHLMPDRSIPTVESGTRHRTAERVARQTGLTVISVSQSMKVVTLYAADERYVVPDLTTLHGRANQAMQALERYRARFDEAVRTLDGLEVSDAATLRDVVGVVARGEMLHRLAVELDRHIAELGTEGRLLRLQADELMAGVDVERLMLMRDYLVGRPDVRRPDAARSNGVRPGAEPVLDRTHADGQGPPAAEALLLRLAELSPQALLEPGALARTLQLPAEDDELDVGIEPRGYRLLSKVPRLHARTVEQLVERFGSISKILAAGPQEMDGIDGIGANRVKVLREGLMRLADVDAR
jgi:diadenylate cyclase